MDTKNNFFNITRQKYSINSLFISIKGKNVKLYIKYMVSIRCKNTVKDELTKLNIKYISIDLGMVEIFDKISFINREKLRKNLLKFGFELLTQKQSLLVDKVKLLIVQIIQDLDYSLLQDYPRYISKKLGTNYTDISVFFSEVNGITIKQFIIINTIEKVKELLLYDELNLIEISQKFHYSNSKKLSYQFKKITGLSPSFYKKLKKKRQVISEL